MGRRPSAATRGGFRQGLRHEEHRHRGSLRPEGDHRTPSRTALDSDEPWLIVARSPCPLSTKKNPGPARRVDQELCKKCKACLRLGCPAIEWVNDEIRVNELLCGGCALCEKVCKEGAFAIAAAGACHE